jgi:hypothetical protein
MRRADTLPNIEDMVVRRVYAIRSRNLSVGVWNGKSGKNAGFIGIRTKFGDRYLFTEYHYDACASFGTVGDARDLGIDVPKDIELRESTPTKDRETDRPVAFDEERGWYFIDTNDASNKIRPCYSTNKKLFDFLDAISIDNNVWEK